MRHLDLFSGIGGFALAADTVWPGIEHTFCEIDPFCQAVLRKHWPKSKIHGDIKTLTNARGSEPGRLSSDERQEISTLRGCDLLTGGFPCQPFSHAGRRKGTNDDRHLWPEMHRVIQEFSPRWVVGENVRGLLSIDGGVVFEQVCVDLEAIGYEVQPFVIPACAVNAPHRRDRIWIVAHAKYESERHTKRRRTGEGASTRATGSDTDATDTERTGYEGKEHQTRQSARCDRGRLEVQWAEDWPTVAARLCTLDDGLPDGLVRPKGWRNAALKAAGNAIVPQVAMEIFRAIKYLPPQK